MNSLSVALFCVSSIFMSLATFTTILRCIVRIRMLKSFGIDDYFMVAAAVFYILAESFVFDAVRVTHDKALIDLIPIVSRAMKSMYFGELFYALTVWILKLSIGTFLLRFIVKPTQRKIIYGVLLIVSLYNTAYFIMVIFQCTPVSHFWHPFGKGTCLPGKINTYTSYAHAIVIGGSDLVFSILPIFVVWNLQMNTAMKFSVAGLLGMGVIAGITTFIRMPYLKALGEATVLDFVGATSHLAIWTCIEPGVGITIGSLAALRPLFRSFLGGSMFSGGQSNDTPAQTRYLPSSNSKNRNTKGSYVLESFAEGRKGSVVTTIGKGKKNGKIHRNENDSEEALTLGKDLPPPPPEVEAEHGFVKYEIRRTVEFVNATPRGRTQVPEMRDDNRYILKERP